MPDSTLLKAGCYVLFLLAYALWLYCIYKFGQKAKEKGISNEWFWINQFFIIINSIFIFLFIYILSGHYDFYLNLMFFVSLELSAILYWVLDGLLGAPTLRPHIGAQVSGYEMASKQTLLFITLLGLTVVAWIAYPIAIAFPYFANSAPNPEYLSRIFRWTMYGIFLSNYPFITVLIMKLVASEHLDEQSRTKGLISLVSGLIPVVLFSMLILRTLGIGADSVSIVYWESSLSFNPELLIAAFATLLFMGGLPYAIGFQRGKRKRIEFLQRRKDYMDDVLNIIDFPSLDPWVERLILIRDRVETEWRNTFEDNTSLIELYQVKEGKEVQGLEQVSEFSFEMRKVDARIDYLAWLDDFHSKLTHSAYALDESNTLTEKQDVAHRLGTALEKRRQWVQANIQDERNHKPPVVLLFSVLLIPLASYILSESAKLIWTLYTQGV
jgi:hypothetical protein